MYVLVFECKYSFDASRKFINMLSSVYYCSTQQAKTIRLSSTYTYKYLIKYLSERTGSTLDCIKTTHETGQNVSAVGWSHLLKLFVFLTLKIS